MVNGMKKAAPSAPTDRTAKPGKIESPSRIHSISHESRGQAPINHKHNEAKEYMMEQEQILNQCRNIARRKGLKIIRANAVGLFIIADAQEN